MGRLSDFLDADWERLTFLSNTSQRPRRLRDSLSPRFAPVVLIRIAQFLYAAGWCRLAKLPALVNFVVFGIEVPPRLTIGSGLVVMHTQGTVLGANSIGNNFTVYHQVTLGAKGMDFKYTLTQRPSVGNNVTVSVGAKVLGGITLEDGCVVAASAVVLKDVPAGFTAIGIPARNIGKKSKIL